jgi:hypothetical protein
MIYSQRDQRWGNLFLGNSNTYIKDFGCTITSIAMIVGDTPNIVNEKLKAVGGFLGNLVIWAKISEAYPNFTVQRVWAYNYAEVMNNLPNVIVEVPAYPIGGSGSHWVNYISHTELQDPWAGKVRPLTDFPHPTGYCLIVPKGGTQNPSVPPEQEFTMREQFRLLFSVLHSNPNPTEADIDGAIGSALDPYNYGTQDLNNRVIPISVEPLTLKINQLEASLKEANDKITALENNQSNPGVDNPLPQPNPESGTTPVPPAVNLPGWAIDWNRYFPTISRLLRYLIGRR